MSAEQPPVDGQVSARTEPLPHRPRRPLTNVIAAVVLVLSLAGWGWFASETGRDGWWAFGTHLAVEPDGQGWANVETVRVRLAGAEAVPDIDGDQPPAGFAYVELDFEVDAGPSDQLSTCDVTVSDHQGREFLAGQEVPRGDKHSSSLQCGTTDPVEDPVPSLQSMVVLVPTDAELTAVQVTGRGFPPATFIELPLPS